MLLKKYKSYILLINIVSSIIGEWGKLAIDVFKKNVHLSDFVTQISGTFRVHRNRYDLSLPEFLPKNILPLPFHMFPSLSPILPLY